MSPREEMIPKTGKAAGMQCRDFQNSAEESDETPCVSPGTLWPDQGFVQLYFELTESGFRIEVTCRRVARDHVEPYHARTAQPGICFRFLQQFLTDTMPPHSGCHNEVGNERVFRIRLDHVLGIESCKDTDEPDNPTIVFGHKDTAVPFTAIIEQMLHVGRTDQVTVNPVLFNRTFP
jgi:hypothetical protein